MIKIHIRLKFNCFDRPYRSLARRIRQNWLDELEEQPTNQSHLSKRTTTLDNLDADVSAVIYFVLGDTTPIVWNTNLPLHRVD